MGKTIFVSSHILPELADFCTSVGIMERGQLVVAGRVHDIVRKLEGSIWLDVRFRGELGNGERALKMLRGNALVKEAQVEGHHLRIAFTGTHDELPQLLGALMSGGLPITSFAPREADLEDVFMKVTKGLVQ